MNVTINNKNITKATLLDPNGYPVREIKVEKNADSLKFDCPKDTMYIHLHN